MTCEACDLETEWNLKYYKLSDNFQHLFSLFSQICGPHSVFLNFLLSAELLYHHLWLGTSLKWAVMFCLNSQQYSVMFRALSCVYVMLHLQDEHLTDLLVPVDAEEICALWAHEWRSPGSGVIACTCSTKHFPSSFTPGQTKWSWERDGRLTWSLHFNHLGSQISQDHGCEGTSQNSAKISMNSTLTSALWGTVYILLQVHSHLVKSNTLTPSSGRRLSPVQMNRTSV